MTTTLLVLLFTNVLRAQPVVVDPGLSALAQVRAEQLCNDQQWSHQGFYDYAKKSGYEFFGENLARRYPDVFSAFIGWIHSPSHLKNIQDKHFTHIGVGEDKRCQLIVEFFGGEPRMARAQ